MATVAAQLISEPAIAPAPPAQPARDFPLQQSVTAAVAAPIPGAEPAVEAARTRTGLGAAAEGFILAADTIYGPATPAGSGPAFAVLPLLAQADPARSLYLAARDIRDIQLAVAQERELVQLRVGLASRSEAAAIEELQRTLRSPMFSDQLDRMRSNVQEELELEKSVTISVAGVSLGLSLVYVLWLVRGGILMGSYLSALPAWRVLDPLPVLSRVDDDAEEDDDALDAVADGEVDPLRGFG